TLTIEGFVVVEIGNAGDTEVTTPFVIRIWEDTDGDGELDASDPILDSTTIPAGVPAGGVLVRSLFVEPATTAFFHPLLWIVADAEDAIVERREDDNQVPVFGDCLAPAPEPSFEPIEEWWLRDVDVETAPVVVQLSDDNGDGSIDSRDVPDVVFAAEEAQGRTVIAASGLDGSRLWTFRSSAEHPLPLPLNHVAAADLDGDGVAEVLAARRDGRLVCLDHQGNPRWVSDAFEGVGERTAGGIAVGDLDGDGVPEIVVGRAVLSNEGTFIAQGTKNRGRNENFYGPLGTRLVPGATDYPHSILADVDLDGRQEIVAGDAVYRLVDGALEVVWDRVAPDRLMDDGFSAVGNFDADPEAEIVYVSSNQVMILNHDGSVFASSRLIVPFSALERATFWGGAPTVADLTGDGVPEIVVAGDTQVVAFRSSLSVLWRRSIDDQAAITSTSAFDFDGDGFREVVYLDNRTFYVLDGRTGAVLHSRPNLSKTASEYPVVADVDGDGRAEILVPSNASFSGDTSTRGLHV
ncbi:MAG TPA: VCBS repeat-containing protein, partial [Thermoanaerobaculia bacterium]